MSFDVGPLVHARGREWVVLPESKVEDDLLDLRPLGGSEDEITGIYLPLEPDVREARFPPVRWDQGVEGTGEARAKTRARLALAAPQARV